MIELQKQQPKFFHRPTQNALMVRDHRSWDETLHELKNKMNKNILNVSIRGSVIQGRRLSLVLESVQRLIINQCKLQDIELTKFSNLEFLDLSRNLLRQVPQLPEQSYLSKLNLSYNQIKILNYRRSYENIQIEIFGNPLEQLDTRLISSTYQIHFQWSSTVENFHPSAIVSIESLMLHTYPKSQSNNLSLSSCLKSIIFHSNTHLMSKIISLFPVQQILMNMLSYACQKGRQKILMLLLQHLNINNGYIPQRISTLNPKFVQPVLQHMTINNFVEGLQCVPLIEKSKIDEFFNLPLMKKKLNSLIFQDKQLLQFLKLTDDTFFIRPLIGILTFLEDYQFGNLQILDAFLCTDDPALIQSLGRFVNFTLSVYRFGIWKKTVKPNWYSYHMHYKNQKKYIKEMNQSSNTLPFLPQYRKPCSFFWNSSRYDYSQVEEHEILKQYQIIQRGKNIQEQDLTLTINPKNIYSYSIAKKIHSSIQNNVLDQKKKQKFQIYSSKQIQNLNPNLL